MFNCIYYTLYRIVSIEEGKSLSYGGIWNMGGRVDLRAQISLIVTCYYTTYCMKPYKIKDLKCTLFSILCAVCYYFPFDLGLYKQ